MLSDYFDAYVTRYKPYKGGAFCYEDGCIYRGLELLFQATGQTRWRDHLLRLITPQIGEGPTLVGYQMSDYNIDNILTGRSLLYLHGETGEDRYLGAANLLARQLVTQPRTKSGVYWHKLRYPWQIWLDGLYMGAPFQIAHAQLSDRPEAIQDSLRQISTALDLTFNPANGLYSHAYDEARAQQWADPETGLSPAYWARAIGWLAMCLVDVADLVGPEAFEPLRQRTTDLMHRLMALRQPNGLWLQVIDQPDLPGNYAESSASAMFVYALQNAARLGLLDTPTEGMIDHLIAGTVRKTPDGGAEMFDICEVAGLGPFENRYRDGSPEYYLTERRVADDAKGVGPLMMSVATAMRTRATK